MTERPPLPSYGSYQQSYAQRFPGQAATQRPYGASQGSAATPDGEPLAGWGWRALAVALDTFLAIPLYVVASLPVVIWQWPAVSSWFNDVLDASTQGRALPENPAVLDPGTGPGLALALSIVTAVLLYELVFLRWKQATPGKLIVGLRVRLRARAGLPWSAILPRVLFVVGIAALSKLPVAGLAFGFTIIGLLDYLWPLWDSKKQALHDKVAKTNVVKLR
jgi:uncharacterized RDD family membrane protein YckC